MKLSLHINHLQKAHFLRLFLCLGLVYIYETQYYENMAIATNQKISNYYDFYRDTEVIFTREILKTLRVDPRQIYIKCNGTQWPCIINSTSFQMAKIILGRSGGAFAEITKQNIPPSSLRFCFLEHSKDLVSFFISGKVTEVTPYMNSKDLAIITLTFTQRPPDDFILKLGSLIEANENFINRKEERIIINNETKHRLNIEKEEALIHVQGMPRKCVLRDLSFSGAKILLLGLPQFVLEKEISLQISFSEPVETVEIKGTVIAATFVNGRQDIVMANIKFDESSVPISYKMHINDYITFAKKKMLELSSSEQTKTARDIENATANMKEKLNLSAKTGTAVQDIKDSETGDKK